MRPNLLPTDPLSQVVSIHDYLQLVFQDSCFSIYNAAALCSNGDSLRQDQPGFCDRLVGLIGQSLLGVIARDNSPLTLTFQDGTILSVASDGPGPEAWQFNSVGNPVVVEQNA